MRTRPWTFEQKQATRAYQRDWFNERRLAWIKENGPCAECGGTEKLQVDHIDPKTKTCNPKALWSRRKSVRDAELAKCQVLCEACHINKTRDEKIAKRKHGTHAMYRRGKCRCDLCVAWKRGSYG